MRNLNAIVAELNAKGDHRIGLVLGMSGSQRIIRKGKVDFDATPMWGHEYPGQQLPEGMSTRLIRLTAKDQIGTLPASMFQVHGIQKFGAAEDVIRWTDSGERSTLIALFDNKAKPMSKAEVILHLFGSEEAFDKLAFITIETLDPQYALSPSDRARLALELNPLKRAEIIQSKVKLAYPTMVDAQGRTVKNRNAQPVVVYHEAGGRKVPIFSSDVLISDMSAEADNGQILDAFKQYRAESYLDEETGEQRKVFREGSYNEIARTTGGSIADDITRALADVNGAAVRATSRDISIPTEESSLNEMKAYLKGKGVTKMPSSKVEAIELIQSLGTAGA